MGVLERVLSPKPDEFFHPGDRYALTPAALSYLVRGRPEDLSGLIDLEFESFITPAGLLKAIESDAPQVYGASDPWQVHGRDQEKARRFSRAMKSISAKPARALARKAFWAGRRHLLDVGGGAGVFSIACLEEWPDLRATVLEIEPVCLLAEQEARDAGVSDRLRTVPADMFRDRWPSGADTILFSQILHDWPPDRGRILVNRAFEALGSGGMVLVHEKLLDSRRSSPLANALVGLDMLLWTEGQQYSEAQLKTVLESEGFRDVQAEPTSGYWTVTRARKP
jgi:hypothetical protein